MRSTSLINADAITEKLIYDYPELGLLESDVSSCTVQFHDPEAAEGAIAYRPFRQGELRSGIGQQMMLQGGKVRILPRRRLPGLGRGRGSGGNGVANGSASNVSAMYVVGESSSSASSPRGMQQDHQWRHLVCRAVPVLALKVQLLLLWVLLWMLLLTVDTTVVYTQGTAVLWMLVWVLLLITTV
jgi:hypothetical protein